MVGPAFSIGGARVGPWLLQKNMKWLRMHKRDFNALSWVSRILDVASLTWILTSNLQRGFEEAHISCICARKDPPSGIFHCGKTEAVIKALKLFQISLINKFN